MKKHNFWGDPDDVEPLPDWMNPETHRNPFKKRLSSRSLEQAAAEILRQPPIDISKVDAFTFQKLTNEN